MDEKYRCKETVDLEELIAMKVSDDKPKNVEAKVLYVSGREEIVRGKLNQNGMADQKFQSKLNKLRTIPTVKDIKITKS